MSLIKNRKIEEEEEKEEPKSIMDLLALVICRAEKQRKVKHKIEFLVK